MQHMKLVMQAVSLLLAMIGVPVDINKTPFVSEEDIFFSVKMCFVWCSRASYNFYLFSAGKLLYRYLMDSNGIYIISKF